VSQKSLVVIVAIVLTGLAVLLVAGHGPWAGHEIVAFSHTHGLNTGDIPVLGGWVVGMACCWRLWPRK
jgi:hypothetical protein